MTEHMTEPAAGGWFGEYGGRYLPESLMPACIDLESAFRAAWSDPSFKAEYNAILSSYAGRPTPVTFCERLSELLGVQVYLKREDLTHTGSHKINNVIGQALLARRMGKQRVIAETGAGQHGVATATASRSSDLTVSSTWAPSTSSAKRSTCFACACWGPKCVRSSRVVKP